LCIAGIRYEDLSGDLAKALDLPARPATLMRVAQRLEDAIPSFRLAALETIDVSGDDRAMLGRAPVVLEGVYVNGIRQDRVVVEQLQMVAAGSDSAYFVQLQFLVSPGDDLTAWRQIQESLRTLRFLERAPTGPPT
jgi:hypothetical protein